MSTLKKLNDSIKAPTSSRSLSADEWKLCTDVFLSSNLPDRDDITITNGAGKDGRPFTVPTSTQDGIKGALLGMLYPPLLIPSLEWGVIGSKVRGFTINVGPDFYDDLAARCPDDQDHDAAATLIHEMTHVWQGENSTWTASYMWRSLGSQALHGSAAYDYRPLSDWKSYNPEQQAKLVEDWFYAGATSSDDRFRYIRDFVRRGIT